MKYLVANWKCYKTEQESLLWLEGFLQSYVPVAGVEIVLAPSFLSLSRMAERIAHSGVSGISLAAQNISAFPRGGYTGEISADLLAPYARYAIIGHSERRVYCRETENDVANKVAEATEAGLIPILCLEDGGLALQRAVTGDVDDILLAYTPPSALSSNRAEPIERVKSALAEVKRVRPLAKCIYGGAVNESNAHLYWNTENIDGVFVGKASHDYKSFLALLGSCLGKS